MIDFSVFNAMRRAGYSENTIKSQSSRITHHPDISAAITQLKQRQLNAARVTSDDIVRVAWEIAQDAEAPPASRVSALSLLAKRHIEFSEKHEITSDAILRVNALTAIAEMSPEILLQLSQGARNELT